MSTITQTISDLHDHYAELVNLAVADDDTDRANRLAAEFDEQVLETVRRRVSAAA